ncbi:MAG: hypothetical protein AMJ92_06345 [candidate division Zixibacteria bacterium SM23_81]|nr:MAG: hypothetical protein AMJ92_06345 [candidate division Zixibacteria bacterium SM23_81]
MSQRVVVTLLTFLFLAYCSTATAGFAVGPNLFLSMPQEDFANVSGNGGGVGIKFLFSPPVMVGIGARADLAFVVYGSETRKGEVAGIPVDVETRNQSVQFTVGPQFQTPMGPARFYAAPMAGVYNYSTEVEIEGTDIGKTDFSTTKFGWNFTGGMLVKVYSSPLGKFDLDVDLMAKYHTIKDAVETEIDGQKETTDSNDITLHAGVLFSF